MYAAFFRALPGPVWLRVILVLILLAAVVVALFQWVFPWVETILPDPDLTVET